MIVNVYDAEIHGVLEGMRVALVHPMAICATDIILYLENVEAILSLHTVIVTISSSR